MVLFPRRYDMIIELTRLEELMPTHNGLLRDLSKIIRRDLWPNSYEQLLAHILKLLNDIIEIAINDSYEDISFIELYIYLLKKFELVYAKSNLNQFYAPVIDKIYVYRNQALIKEQWRQSNPYYFTEYSKDKLYTKNIIQILDEVLAQIKNKYEKDFYISLDQIKDMYRGRLGSYTCVEDLEAPSLEVAKKCNIINRWNPSNKRYLYLGIGLNAEETCLEEMRAKSGSQYTLAKFNLVENNKKEYVLDLGYEDISRQDIENYFESQKKDAISKTITEVKRSDDLINEIEIKKEIKKVIKKRNLETQRFVTIYFTKRILKEICEAIFEPLDAKEDKDKKLKDKCYKSFHILAEYLEKEGFAGVVYPSTRMKLKGKMGKNLVLFNADIVVPNIDTFKTVIYRE